MAILFILTSDSAGSHAEPLSPIVLALFEERGTRVVSLQFPALEASVRTHLWVLQAFSQLADAIEQAAGQDLPQQLRTASVIVDIDGIDDLDQLDALSTISNPHATVTALLILTFPEVRWMFRGSWPAKDPHLIEEHLLRSDLTPAEILAAYDSAFVPLFDPTGLRERVRARVRTAQQGNLRPAPYVPSRKSLAVAMDEESGYAFLNSYVAYRFGYRCHAITSYEGALRFLRSDVQRLLALAGEVFEREGSISTAHYLASLVKHYPDTVKQICPDEAVALALFLKTSKFEEALKIRNLSRTATEEELLGKARARASDHGRSEAHLVDVASTILEEFGFKVLKNGSTREDEPAIALSLEDCYLNFADKDPELNPHLSNEDERIKTFGALGNIPHRVFVTTGHEQGQVPARQQTNDDDLQYRQPITVHKPCSGIFDIWARLEACQPADFVWPPKPVGQEKSDESGHSAHGRLLLVAERLIARAQRILESTHTIPDAVHGAVLALDAKEYLGHRTPTTSLEALALQHQLEVRAECSFYGIEHNMDVKSRFAEIEIELNSIGEWVRPSQRKLSRLNSELRIVSEIVLIFRDLSQFDEEQQSLVKLRRLHRSLWFHRNRRWGWIIWLFRAYAELMLRSLGWLGAAFASWLVVLTIFYVVSGHGGGPSMIENYWHGFVDTMISFIGLSPPHDMDKLWVSPGPGVLRVCMAAIALGFLHLGIFITHLYAILARR